METSAEQTFINDAYDKIRYAIMNIDEQLCTDIYALSFWKSNLDDDPRRPVISVGYNTISRWSACTPAFGRDAKHPISSSSQEAKWNFAFWLQNEEVIIGGDDPQFIRWVKQLPYYYDDNLEDEDFDQALALGAEIQESFMETIIQLSLRLHADGIITNKFGRPIPIIIHLLEYYDVPLNWTKRGNPEGLVTEFEQWVNSGYE